MGRLILLRHGETEANVNKKFCGHTETPLLHPPFGGINTKIKTDYLYCSPLSRCTDYIKYFEYKTLQLDDKLKEINFGLWENMTFSEIEDCSPYETTAYINAPVSYQFPNGESFDDIILRVSSFYKNIEKELKTDKDVTIISHAGAIKAFIIIALKLDKNFFLKIKIENERFTTIDHYYDTKETFCTLTGVNLKKLL